VILKTASKGVQVTATDPEVRYSPGQLRALQRHTAVEGAEISDEEQEDLFDFPRSNAKRGGPTDKDPLHR
jgi:hypothetical protein